MLLSYSVIVTTFDVQSYFTEYVYLLRWKMYWLPVKVGAAMPAEAQVPLDCCIMAGFSAHPAHKSVTVRKKASCSY
jgi:hypothetical protein